MGGLLHINLCFPMELSKVINSCLMTVADSLKQFTHYHGLLNSYANTYSATSWHLLFCYIKTAHC